MNSTVPLIGVTSYGRLEKVVVNPPDQAHYLVAATYVDAVRRADGAAVVLPGDEPHVERWLDALDGIVFSGGGDLAPSLYGGDEKHAALRSLHPDRDAAELALTRAVLARGDIPALFICRGIQVLNVALGGTLHEHIGATDQRSGVHGAVSGGGFWAREQVEIVPDTILARATGCCAMTVSSSHHQAIRAVAKGLRVSAVAVDGIVEAVEVEGHPFLLGVQWHPEVDVATDPRQARLFEALIGAARRIRSPARDGVA